MLVAEDNEVNQRVAVRILEKLGYRVDVVGTGREAVDACAWNVYAAVLMDNQMPEMDGFEATAKIRAREGEARHTPIIAMTASAMPGDRERCLAAGMDDYVSKPVSPESLDQALSRFIERAPSAGARSGSAAAPVDGSVLDQLQAIDEGGSLLVEVIDTFLRIAPVRLVRAGAGGGEEGRRRASSAPPTASWAAAPTSGRVRMAEICALLETRARAGSVDGALALVEELHAEYAKVKAALEERRERVRARE